MAANTVESWLRGQAIAEFATAICNKLLEEGIIIHRYDAYSTNSVYLKLDYGVANSIRISDHKGKPYLKYRYNIGTDIKEMELVMDKFPRRYYPVSEGETMVDQIVKDRNEKLEKYGKSRYTEFMRKNKREHEADKGFWSTSRRVF